MDAAPFPSDPGTPGGAEPDDWPPQEEGPAPDPTRRSGARDQRPRDVGDDDEVGDDDGDDDVDGDDVEGEAGTGPAVPPVVAVVVTCDPGWWLEACLEGLRDQDYPGLSVLVVA